MNIGWRWCTWMTLLLLFNVMSISISVSPSVVDHGNKISDSYIYGLCNANKYISGSEYERNLKKLLKSLVNGAAPSGGLATHTYGGVQGLVQCRPDISRHECQSCSAAASERAFQGCPNAISARVQFEFCFIRYENYTFASVLDTSVAYSLESSKSNSNIHGFNHTLANLMATLARKAPLHVNRFATGAQVVKHSSVTVYGLQMCLTTLAAPDCRACLRQAIGLLNKCCSSEMGAQIYLGSCSVRFEIYPF